MWVNFEAILQMIRLIITMIVRHGTISPKPDFKLPLSLSVVASCAYYKYVIFIICSLQNLSYIPLISRAIGIQK